MECAYGKTLQEIKDLHFHYPGDGYYDDGSPIYTLKGVNGKICDIEGHGQIHGIIGPSGVGKTTLFKLLAGLDKPTSGYVHVFNDHKEEVRAGMVGMVRQDYRILRHRTVLGNLMRAAMMKSGLTRSQAKEKSMMYLKKFGIEDKAHKFPIQLSGGQRQRVAIVQQLLCSEHYILFDEIWSGLDLIAKEEVTRTLKAVSEEDGENTFIVITHDLEQATAVSDHLWLLGRDRDDKGEPIKGARIIKEYDLVAADLAWHDGIAKQRRFWDFVHDVSSDFRAA